MVEWMMMWRWWIWLKIVAWAYFNYNAWTHFNYDISIKLLSFVCLSLLIAVMDTAAEEVHIGGVEDDVALVESVNKGYCMDIL